MVLDSTTKIQNGFGFHDKNSKWFWIPRQKIKMVLDSTTKNQNGFGFHDAFALTMGLGHGKVYQIGTASAALLSAILVRAHFLVESACSFHTNCDFDRW
jgi:hypothetical protein